jgi:hypothetical protein
MADRMSTPVPHWEKSGNVTWVACRFCRGWFPVETELAEQHSFRLACPHCGEQFSAGDAADKTKP